MRTPEEFARDYFGAARTTTDERAIAARDAEWMPKVETVEKELKTMTYMWRALVENAPKLHGEIKRLRAEVEAARAPLPMLIYCPLCNAKHIDEGEFAAKVHHTHACQGCGHVWRPAVVPTVGVEFLPGYKNEFAAPPADSPVPAATITLSKGPDAGAHPWPQTALPSFRTVAGADLFLSNSVWVAFDRFEAKVLAPVLARLDALELAAREDAKAWADSMLKLFTKVTALERVVKRIDTEHAEMCPQHTGLAAPPAPVAIPMLPPRRAHVYIDPEDEDEPAPVAEAPMCYQIDCRYYGQRHVTTHEPKEPEAAGLVHAFVAGVGSVCWHYHPPKDGSAGFFCHAPLGNPIHATERK